MKVFFTSIGRRVELIKCFKESIENLYVIGCDCNPYASASQVVDKFYLLQRNIDEKYVNDVLNISIKNQVDFIIPLIDNELLIFAENSNLFKQNGIEILISPYESVKICMNKLLLYRHLNDTCMLPTTYSLSEYLQGYNNINSDKVILKPISPSSYNKSVWVLPNEKQKIMNFIDILELKSYEFIVQEYIPFEKEITVDLMLHNHSLLGMVQRERLKVRAGEVEQAKVVYYPEIEKFIENIVNKIKFSWILNIQLYLLNKKIYLGEINPRIGGGYPLSYRAGLDFPRYLNNLFIHRKNNNEFKPSKIKNIKNNLIMSRYDNGFYWFDKE